MSRDTVRVNAARWAQYERLMLASEALTDAERDALRKWEHEYLDGAEMKTSDWPGWERIYRRIES